MPVFLQFKSLERSPGIFDTFVSNGIEDTKGKSETQIEEKPTKRQIKKRENLDIKKMCLHFSNPNLFL